MATAPTHEQAQLHLQVYDLRREARLRQARDWFQQNFAAETIEDAFRIAPPGTEHGLCGNGIWVLGAGMFALELWPAARRPFLRDQRRVFWGMGIT